MSTGTENIVSSITSDAQLKAKSIVEEAGEKSKSILSHGEEEALTNKNKILAEAKKQADMHYQRLISEAKMNSRKMELEAREEIIEEAFGKAREKLSQIASSGSSEYVESLNKLIVEAVEEIGGGELVVLLKKDDVSKIEGSLPSIADKITEETGVKTSLELGKETINTIGGAIVKTKNGEIEVNNTVEARLLRFKKTLRSQVAKILFN